MLFNSYNLHISAKMCNFASDKKKGYAPLFVLETYLKVSNGILIHAKIVFQA